MAVLQPLIAADVNAVMMAVVVAVGLVPGARVVRMGSVMTSDAERIGIVHPDCHVLVAFAKRAQAVQALGSGTNCGPILNQNQVTINSSPPFTVMCDYQESVAQCVPVAGHLVVTNGDHPLQYLLF